MPRPLRRGKTACPPPAGPVRCWRRMRPKPPSAQLPTWAAPADDRRPAASLPGGAPERARLAARAVAVGSAPGHRQRHRGGARACRRSRLSFPGTRRRRRHEHGGPLAGLGAEAVHLRPGVREWRRPPRDDARRPSLALRALRPENFDLSYQGTVTARRALQLSLNVPAVELLAELGPSRLLARLRNAGAEVLCRPRPRPASPSRWGASASG